jgi:O-antigen/teichoic acid export membrane protein
VKEVSGETGRRAEEDLQAIAAGAAATLVGRGIGNTLLFFSQIVIARWLGAEAFGLYSLGMGVVRLSEIVARLGLSTGGMRFVAIHRFDRNRLSAIVLSSVGLALGMALLVMVLLWIGSSWLSTTFFRKSELADTLRWFVLGIPAVAVMNVATALLLGFHTTKDTVYVRHVLQPVAFVVLLIPAWLFHWGLQAAVLAFVVSNVVALIAALICLRARLPTVMAKPSRHEMQSILIYSLPLLFVGVLQYFLNWADTLILGGLASSRDVGIYRVASQLAMVMTVFLVATNSIYAPVAAQLYSTGDLARLEHVLRTSTRWVGYGAVPVFMVLAIWSNQILALFGHDFAMDGVTSLLVLAGGQLVNCLTGGVGFTLAMTGRQKTEALNSLAMVALNVGLSFVLIPTLGVLGAALASSGATVAVNILRVGQVYRLYRILPFSRAIGALVPVCAAVLLTTALKGYGITSTGTWVATSALATAAALILFCSRTDDDRAAILFLVERAGRWRR